MQYIGVAWHQQILALSCASALISSDDAKFLWACSSYPLGYTKYVPSTTLKSTLIIETTATFFDFWFPEIIEGLRWFRLYLHDKKHLNPLRIISSIVIEGLVGIVKPEYEKSSTDHIAWRLTFLEILPYRNFQALNILLCIASKSILPTLKCTE